MEIRDYRRKVYGAWLGKAVGGTLGAPYEGADGPLNLSFYDPVPTEMLPNDDLDLQVVWACHLNTDWNGVVSRRNFEQAWRDNVHFCWDEYGLLLRNMSLGLHAPQTGSYDNFFKDGLGAAIRSELWACLAPGEPKLAAKFCYEDACLDHCGDGIYAEQFLAAMESVAFIDASIEHALDAGLDVIPAESRLACAIRDTRKWCAAFRDFWEVRKRIMENYGADNFTDVVMNLSIEVAALLLCDDDFSKAVCLAVNGGNDTDCTGATVGAFMGIRNPDCIDARWLKPIGTSLVLSKEITGLNPPDDLQGFTDMVVALRDKVTLQTPELDAAVEMPRRIVARAFDFEPWFYRDFHRFSPKIDAAKAHEVVFNGNFVKLDLADLAPNALRLFEVQFKVDVECDVKVMVNSPAATIAWVDDAELFRRECGLFIPAFHRAPANQSAVVHLAAGIHRLCFGVRPNAENVTLVPLVFGVGDTQNFWLPDAF